MMRRSLSLRTVLMLTISTMTLLITLLVMHNMYQQWDKLKKIQELKTATLASDPLFDAMERLSIERDIAYSLLFTDDDTLVKNLRPRLDSSRKEADAALAQALESLRQYNFPGLDEQIRNEQTQITVLADIRKKVDAARALPVKQRDPALAGRSFEQVSQTIRQTENVWLAFIRYFREVDPVVSLQMRFKYDLRAIMENSARERALIGRLIVQNADASPEERISLVRWQGAVDEAWDAADTLAEQGKLYPGITLAFKEAKSHYDNVYGMVHNMFYVPDARHGKAYPFTTDFWFELSEQTSDSFYELKTTVIQQTHAYLDTLETKAQQAIAWQATLLLCALFLCVYSFRVITDRVIRPIDTMVGALVDVMQGKPSSFVLSTNVGDEISKLEQVLYAFQKNTADIIRTAAEKEKLIEDLKRSNQELDDFAYIASHDLKEPLRGLFNNAKFLQEDYHDKIDTEGVKRLDRLGYLCQRMETLVNDLLYFSRLGRQDLAMQPVDLNAIIHDIEGMTETTLKERNAKIIIPKPLPTIICDKPRVTEAFRNLIVNAIKYNDKPHKIIEVGCLPDGTFYVRDNGIGIEKEFYNEIFRIFKRLNQEDDDKKGTGVGLTFVKKIIERHGGRIWLESVPGEGTTFYFTIKEGTAYVDAA